MASDFDDPSKWRLKTPLGTPYKWKSLEGDFEPASANMSIEVLIRSTDMLIFAEEMLPPPVQFGNLFIPQYTLFGKTNLRVAKVAFKSFDDGSPIDPFGFDPLAPSIALGQKADTYYPVILATISFASPTFPTPDAADPTTFLEVRGSTSGEFLHATPTATFWQDVDEKGNYVGDPEKNRQENVPCTVLNPQTQWTVKWSRIPLTWFASTLKPRLDSVIGKINSKPFSVLRVAAPQTLLFSGYDYDYSLTWQSTFINQPMVTLNLKFLEKNILWANQKFNSDGSPVLVFNPQTQKSDPQYGPKVIRGHNDFWRPGVGWTRMLINNREVFDSTDFNTVFSVS